MIGSILFNGNIVFETDFIYLFQERIIRSHHVDPQVRETKKVLLVTAAWAEEEFHESHIKHSFQEIGIRSIYQNGFDINIQNLSAYHECDRFMKLRPEIAELFRNAKRSLRRAQEFYFEQNVSLVALLQKHTRMLKRDFPDANLPQIFAYDVLANQKRIAEMNACELLWHHSCQEIQGTLRALILSDKMHAKIYREIQDYFKSRSGIAADPEYQLIRSKLVERIRSANSIFIFGGYVEALYDSLDFWDLGPALQEALLRGTNFYTISAGSVILCKQIIVYDQFGGGGFGKREFEFFNHGFGLVTRVTLLPHCMDRIQTDDPENLAYLANRFQGPACVGLNQESFLLMDAHREKNGRYYPRFTSVGRNDGVYLFDTQGRKIKLEYGMQLVLPGTFIWEQKQSRGETPDPIVSQPLPAYQGESPWNVEKAG